MKSIISPRNGSGRNGARLERIQPGRFIETLRACGALVRIFPELDRLFGVPQPPSHHPEIDTGVHTLLALEQAVRLGAIGDPFAVLVHDLGKGTTPPADWPRHLGHEQRGAELVRALCQRIHTPNMYRELGVLTARFHKLVSPSRLGTAPENSAQHFARSGRAAQAATIRAIPDGL